MADHDNLDQDVDREVERREKLAEKYKSRTDAELREEQGEIIGIQKRMLNEAPNGLSKEDDGRFDELTDKVEDLSFILNHRKDQRESKVKAEERAAMLAAKEEELNRPGKRKSDPDPINERRGGDHEIRGQDGKLTRLGIDPTIQSKRDPQYDAVLRKWAVQGWNHLSQPEVRAMQADVDNIGGSLTMDQQFVNQLIKFVDDRLHLLQLSSVFTVTDADSAFFPSWDTDPADADWTSELGTGSEDSSTRTGGRELRPRPLGKSIKISRTLLRKAMQPAEQLIRDRLGYKFQVTLERAMLSGTGMNQPLGVFTASANGISTGRDISTGNTSTAITADGLIEAKYNLKEQYMQDPALRWVFSRTAVKNIRKLKDGNGDYLWNRGLGGTPNTILDTGYIVSEFAPSTFTASQYVGVLGVFSWVYTVFALRMELQRLDELHALTNQVGFIGRMEVDAMPVLEEAFSRIQLAA